MVDHTKSEIIITHCQNPSQFWFKYARPNLELLQFEMQLWRHAISLTNKQPNEKKPAVGDIVMIYHVPIMKWLRARVTETTDTIVKAWSIDHGAPVKSDINSVKPLLDDKLANAQIPSVFKACVCNVIPLSATCLNKADDVTWCKEADEAFGDFFKTDGKIFFETKYIKDDHYFGEIFVDGKNETASEFLVRKGFGKTGNFINGPNSLSAVDITRDKENAKKRQVVNTQTNGFTSKNADDQQLLLDIDDFEDENIGKRTRYKSEAERQAKDFNHAIQLEALDILQRIEEKNYKDSLKQSPKPSTSSPLSPASPLNLNHSADSKKDMKLIYQRLDTPTNSKEKLNKSDTSNGLDTTDNNHNVVGENFIAETSSTESTLNGSDDFKHDDLEIELSDDDENDDRCSTLFIQTKSFKHLVGAPKVTRSLVKSKLVEEPVSGPIMVYGEIPIAKPVTDLSLSNFRDLIINHLPTNISTMESYAWPHIMRSNSVFLIDQNNDSSILPAVCSLIYDERNDRTNYSGPKAFCICNDIESAFNIREICNEYLQFAKSVDHNYVVCITDSRNINIKHYNRCEVFITTPHVFPDILTKFPALLTGNIVDLLVVTDVHLMNKSSLRSCLNTILSHLNNRPIQTIVTSKKWVSALQTMWKQAKNPLLLIDSHVESAICCDTIFETKETENPLDPLQKKLNLLGYLQKRTIVICSNDNDVVNVANHLKNISANFIACHTKSSDLQISSAKAWNQDKATNQYDILVCCDAMLPVLNIISAENIIHFTLPENFSKFSFRHSVSLKHYKIYLENDRKTEPLTTSTIFIDTNNSKLAFQYIYYLVSHEKIRVPQKYHDWLQDLKDETEKQKVLERQTLCKDFLNYQVLEHYGQCIDRHEFCILDRIDKSDWANISSNERDFCPTKTFNIKIKILKIISPVLYNVRLLEFNRFNTQWKISNSSDQFERFEQRLNYYYKENKPPQPLEYRMVNQGFLGVYLNNGNYERCRVIKKTCDETGTLKILLIDTGEEIECSCRQILPLNDQFEHFPAQAITMHLTGLLPVGSQYTWSKQALEATNTFFSKATNTKSINDYIFVRATALFLLKDFIFVDNLQVERYINRYDVSPYQVERFQRHMERFVTFDFSNTFYLMGLAAKAEILTTFHYKFLNTHINGILSRAAEAQSGQSERRRHQRK